MAAPFSYPRNSPHIETPPPSLAVIELNGGMQMIFTVDHHGSLRCRYYWRGNCVQKLHRLAVGKPCSPLAAFNTWRGQTGTVADHVHVYFVGADYHLKELCLEPDTICWTPGELCMQYPLLDGTTCCGIAAICDNVLPPHEFPEMHVFFQLSDGTIQQYKAPLRGTHLTNPGTSLSDYCRIPAYPFLPPRLTAANKVGPAEIVWQKGADLGPGLPMTPITAVSGIAMPGIGMGLGVVVYFLNHNSDVIEKCVHSCGSISDPTPVVPRLWTAHNVDDCRPTLAAMNNFNELGVVDLFYASPRGSVKLKKDRVTTSLDRWADNGEILFSPAEGSPLAIVASALGPGCVTLYYFGIRYDAHGNRIPLPELTHCSMGSINYRPPPAGNITSPLAEASSL